MSVYPLQKSYLRVGLAFGLHGMALAALFLSDLGWGFVGLGVPFISGSLYREMRLAFLLTPQSVVSLTRLTQNRWQIHFRKHAAMQVVVLPSSLISRYFLLLQLSPLDARCKSVLIFPDSLRKELLRELRVFLRLECSSDIQ